MNKKLTLNVEESLINYAKTYSKESNQSISSIFEKYLIRLKNETQGVEISEDARELYGIISNTELPDKMKCERDYMKSEKWVASHHTGRTNSPYFDFRLWKRLSGYPDSVILTVLILQCADVNTPGMRC